MFIDEQATSPSSSLSYNLMTFGIALALTGVLVLAGCDSNEVAEDPEIARVEISPDNASIAVGEQVNFSAVALTASGDTVRDLDLRWWSTDPAVFTVEDNGVATGENPGAALCKVELDDDAATNAVHRKAAKRRFVGRDSAFVDVFGN